MSNPLTNPLNSLKISYVGTNVGKIYFSDFDKRLGLGGAQEGNYTGGQDTYIVWGEIKVVQLTDQVIESIQNGVLAYFSNPNNPSWSALNGSPLVMDVAAHTNYENYPSIYFLTGTVGFSGISGLPLTGLGYFGTGMDYAWSDQYLANVLSNPQYAPTGIAGATGYYYGNSI